MFRNWLKPPTLEPPSHGLPAPVSTSVPRRFPTLRSRRSPHGLRTLNSPFTPRDAVHNTGTLNPPNLPPSPPALRQYGIIISVTTTPPALMIRPDENGSQPIPSTILTPIQLENVLKGLSFGKAQVSYTMKQYANGWYAENVRGTGLVDEERWIKEEMDENDDIYLETKRGRKAKAYEHHGPPLPRVPVIDGLGWLNGWCDAIPSQREEDAVVIKQEEEKQNIEGPLTTP